MDIMTDAALLSSIEAFIAREGIAPSRFGLETMGDGALIKQLKEGRSLSLKNAEKVLTFMAEYQPQSTAA